MLNLNPCSNKKQQDCAKPASKLPAKIMPESALCRFRRQISLDEPEKWPSEQVAEQIDDNRDELTILGNFQLSDELDD